MAMKDSQRTARTSRRRHAQAGKDGSTATLLVLRKKPRRSPQTDRGPTVYICDECVNLCNDIIAEDWEEAKEEISSKLRKPTEIKHILINTSIGQDRAKKILVGRRP